MSKLTEQLKNWTSDFGEEYTKRNEMSLVDAEKLEKNRIGQTKRDSFIELIDGLNISNVLEVGCNMGQRLEILSTTGDFDLYGLDPQDFAIEKAMSKYPNINFVKGTAFDIPFDDNFFDLVYTAGVLIHISPDNLPEALSEIYRVSRRFILGFEYYAPDIEMVNYRGHNKMLWKMDFKEAYLKRYPDLRVVRSRILDNINSGEKRLQDIHFILSK